MVTQMDNLLTENFDCDGIDARAKNYDRQQFVAWRDQAKTDGTYHHMMSRVYSGFDRVCIEDIAPWTDQNERQIEDWLGA
jgi:hypothetical protein